MFLLKAGVRDSIGLSMTLTVTDIPKRTTVRSLPTPGN